MRCLAIAVNLKRTVRSAPRTQLRPGAIVFLLFVSPLKVKLPRTPATPTRRKHLRFSFPDDDHPCFKWPVQLIAYHFITTVATREPSTDAALRDGFTSCTWVNMTTHEACRTDAIRNAKNAELAAIKLYIAGHDRNIPVEHCHPRIYGL